MFRSIAERIETIFQWWFVEMLLYIVFEAKIIKNVVKKGLSKGKKAKWRQVRSARNLRKKRNCDIIKGV